WQPRLRPPLVSDILSAQLLAQRASGEPGGPVAAGCDGPSADRAALLRPGSAGGGAHQPGGRTVRVRAARHRRRAVQPGGAWSLRFRPLPPRRHAGDPPAGCRDCRPGGLLPDLPAPRNPGHSRPGRESAIRTWYGVLVSGCLDRRKRERRTRYEWRFNDPVESDRDSLG